MKRVILSIAVIAAGALLITSCSKAEETNAKKSETTSTAMHEHEGHDHGEHTHAMKTDGSAEELIPQKTCPVMGNPINNNLYVDHDGKRMYVCCGGCIDAVKKNPEKYLKKLDEIGETPETL